MQQLSIFFQQCRTHAVPLGLACGAVLGTCIPLLLQIQLFWGIPLLLMALVCWKIQRWAFYVLLGFLTFAGWTILHVGMMHQILDQPVPQSRIWVTGRILDKTVYEKRTRVVLDDLTFYLDAPTDRVQQVLGKITVSMYNSQAESLVIGYGFSGQVKLQRPEPPQFEGDFDGRRYAFLTGVFARGYVMGDVASTYLTGHVPFMARVNAVRDKLAVYVNSQAGAVAAALLTGRREFVRGETTNAFRHSGLAHLLAISGLHVGLVGAFIFFFLRFFAALFPVISLRFPIKQGAAIAALAVCLGYMLLAGATIPTVRAFIMVGLLFAAIIFGKIRVALRLWGLSVLAVLAFWPESILTASFQMSFVATLALIVWALLRAEGEERILPQKGRITYIKGVFTTGLIAGLATMPIAAAHFGMVSFAGFLLNLVAIPLVGFIVLPAGIVGLVLMPLGVDGAAFWVMRQGLTLLEYFANVGGSGWLGHYLGGLEVSATAWPVLAGLSLFCSASLIFNKRLLFFIGFGVLAVTCGLWPKAPAANIITLEDGATVGMCIENECTLLRKSGSPKVWKDWLAYHHLQAVEKEGYPLCKQGEECLYHTPYGSVLVADAINAEACGLVDFPFGLYMDAQCKDWGDNLSYRFIQKNRGMAAYGYTPPNLPKYPLF